MGTCVKTGGILKISITKLCGDVAESFKYEADIKGNYLYGDIHVVGNTCVIYFPEYQEREYKSHHGTLLMRNNDYFYRDTKPYRILVVPSRWILFKEGVLHPLDLAKYSKE